MMTPGDVSMLLNETNGLRGQTTSPSLAGANLRIQGLRGRYTQILADGLPLYGGQTGGLVDWAVGSSRVYLNVENLADVRQTREHPLVRPIRGVDGRWTVDAWAPLEGRTLNAGVRRRF